MRCSIVCYTNVLMSIVVAILALALLIIVHEGGHYLVAKWSGMRVERFSVGFGPALMTWKHKGTKFQLAPIPLGGFVQITGMNPHEEYDAEDPNVYPNRPVILRFLTIFAGPATNVVFSSVLIFFVLALAGEERVQIGNLTEDSPAAGKLLPGDILDKVDGRPGATVPQFRSRIQQAKGRQVTITVLRGGSPVDVVVQPRLKDGTYMVGVELHGMRDRSRISAGEAASGALRYPVEKSALILGGLWEIVTGRAPADAIGPVKMVDYISKSVDEGWVPAFELLAMLNVYLGLFNLLPLPALDGGRLVFLVYELVTRRRPNPKVEAAVHTAGFLVLFVVMILVLFKDIKSLIT